MDIKGPNQCRRRAVFAFFSHSFKLKLITIASFGPDIARHSSLNGRPCIGNLSRPDKLQFGSLAERRESLFHFGVIRVSQIAFLLIEIDMKPRTARGPRLTLRTFLRDSAENERTQVRQRMQKCDGWHFNQKARRDFLTMASTHGAFQALGRLLLRLNPAGALHLHSKLDSSNPPSRLSCQLN